jgi:hypothetical protein
VYQKQQAVLVSGLPELSVIDSEFAELMSGSVWQALVSALRFAIAEGESEIRLRQLLLGILSTYSEHEESEGLYVSLVSPHDARSTLRDCGGFMEKPLFVDSKEFAPIPHQHLPLEKEVAETLTEALHRHAVSGLPTQFTADDLLKSLQPIISKSVPNEEGERSLERQLSLYLRRPD